MKKFIFYSLDIQHCTLLFSVSCVRNYFLFLTNIYIGIQEDFTAWWDGVRSRLFPMLRGALPLEGIYVNSSGDQIMTPEKNTEEVGQYSIGTHV